MRHLGGPETDEQILNRHRRYLVADGPDSGQMFSIRLLPEGVLPPFQGKGIAAQAPKKPFPAPVQRGRTGSSDWRLDLAATE